MNKILKNIKVPTGNICIMQAEKGKLELEFELIKEKE